MKKAQGAVLGQMKKCLAPILLVPGAKGALIYVRAHKSVLS
jgi:hypothetical protein